MKHDTVIPYLKKIQKVYESRDTHLEFSLKSAFFHRKSANFAISRDTDIDVDILFLILSSSFQSL